MKLHVDEKLFRQTILSAAAHLKINPVFVEKDYWITHTLSRLAQSKYATETVFKGGTSLSKGYGLIKRFSEDVDIAVINHGNKSGNEIKTIIRTVEKEMTTELSEIIMEGVTSKGSRFRKSVFQYQSIEEKNSNNKLIVEVNSFANPFPYQPMSIKSLAHDFLLQTGNEKFIDEYKLRPFTVSVLSKEQTLLEKLVSLIRFSYEENPVEAISKKVRHFYDLHYLANDNDCQSFINSATFSNRFNEVLNHDKEIFEEPTGWQTKTIAESPLVSDFNKIWRQLKGTYHSELSALAFAEIPAEEEIEKQFETLISKLNA